MSESSTLVIDDQPPHRERCEQCGASTHPHAKFCWMCGVPVKATTPSPADSASPAKATPAAAAHENSFAIWLTAWLALPVVIAVVYGIGRIEPGYAMLAGPALIIATVVTLMRGTVRAGRGKGQAPSASSSLAVWLVTAASTFAATAAIMAVIAAIMIISVFIAFIRCLQGLN